MNEIVHATDQFRDELHKLYECPVCVQIFRNPKLLPCGHSVCADCCTQLNRERLSLLCPVCRRPSTTPAESLPINFGLRDLVQHYTDKSDAKKFLCVSCERRVAEDDCWNCENCSKLICSHCAVKIHTGHALKDIKELLREKETELSKWRDDLSNVGQQIKSARRQIEANNVRITQNAQHLIKITLAKKLRPQIDADTIVLHQEMLEIQKRFVDVNAVRLIMNETDSRNDLDKLKTDFKTFSDKQSNLLKRQTDILTALRKCESTLASLIIPASRNQTSTANNAKDLSSVLESSQGFADRSSNNLSPRPPYFGLRLRSRGPTICNSRNDAADLFNDFDNRRQSRGRGRGFSYFPSVINLESDDSHSASALNVSNDLISNDLRESSGDEIQAANRLHSPRLINNNSRRVRLSSQSPPTPDVLNPLRRFAEESEPESEPFCTFNFDDDESANRRQNENNVLARYFNQIERRMNNDLDRRNSGDHFPRRFLATTAGASGGPTVGDSASDDLITMENGQQGQDQATPAAEDRTDTPDAIAACYDDLMDIAPINFVAVSNSAAAATAAATSMKPGKSSTSRNLASQQSSLRDVDSVPSTSSGARSGFGHSNSQQQRNTLTSCLAASNNNNKRGRNSPRLFQRQGQRPFNGGASGNIGDNNILMVSDSSEGEHAEGEDDDIDPVDTTIRFRILRKQ